MQHRKAKDTNGHFTDVATETVGEVTRSPLAPSICLRRFGIFSVGFKRNLSLLEICIFFQWAYANGGLRFRLLPKLVQLVKNRLREASC